ncbi:GPN-loop GTPase 3-like [Centruroides sculpturatus]|uniref:GPN-loop GTPase 3-like n=1 Tax=Centruroides sculpturatus TaxID=218467 RepID=UPI000C6CBDD3|nr:GPN-loop GTPase 3-like [Centruroides sculpturatus]
MSSVNKFWYQYQYIVNDSTYCSTIVKHAQDEGRQINVVNLDPAAEYFDYEMVADIRELIHVDDVMEDEELRFGPNGGLIYCMEYLVQNSDWLEEQLVDEEDSYTLFDCPGQIELYTHLDIMRKLVDMLHSWDYQICGVYILDSQFLIEPSKFLSGVLTALSAMVSLEIPHVNVLSKIDLLNKRGRKMLYRFLEPDVNLLLDEDSASTRWSEKYKRLSETIGKVIDDYSLVKFQPLNIKDEESIYDLLFSIDNAIQYGEGLDVKVKVRTLESIFYHNLILNTVLLLFLEPDVNLLLDEDSASTRWSEKYKRLSETIGKVIDDYSLVKFQPLNIKDEESIYDLLFSIDNAIQYGEGLDVKVKDFAEYGDDDDDDS